jgi:Na+-transporting NADH:ubiquinone oxidoreductase subunit NqrD
MTIEVIGIFAVVVGIFSLFRGPSDIVYIFLCSTLLGASAAFVLEAVGGVNISPAHLLLGFLAVRLLNQDEIARASANSISFGRPGYWLLLTVIYSVVCAFLMPRLFAGQTMTFAVRSQDGYSVPLGPATSNLTQSIYFVGDLVCFIVFCGYASTASRRKVLGNAALVCATLNLVFAVLDLATYFTGTTQLLSFIRNANYAMLNDTEVAGFKRITGSFTEASSFGSMTLGYFAFTSKLWLLGVRSRLTLVLTICSLLALLFSTSTTAYVGLAVFLVFAYLQVLVQATYRPMTTHMAMFIFGLPIILAISIMVLAFSDTYWTYLRGLLDTFVLNKMSTESGVERTAWNSQALQNFYETYGFGVGNGSVRASSFPVGVLASLGVLGALIFGTFFATVLFSRTKGELSDPLDLAYRQAAKSVCVAWLITATTSAALIDLGLAFFVFAALACAKPLSSSYSTREFGLGHIPMAKNRLVR